MSDTFIIIIGIGVAVVIIIVFPLMTMSDRTNDVAQLTAEAIVTETLDKIVAKGTIDQSDIDELVESLTSQTGYTYKHDIQVLVKDINLGKKTSQAQADKTGENATYLNTLTQIEEIIGKNGKYLLNEGDMVAIKVESTSPEIFEAIKNWFYSLSGNEAAVIRVQESAMSTTDGK